MKSTQKQYSEISLQVHKSRAQTENKIIRLIVLIELGASLAINRAWKFNFPSDEAGTAVQRLAGEKKRDSRCLAASGV
jgi:hypothetical protein